MEKSEPQLKIGFVLDGGLEKPDGVQQYILALGGYYKSLGHEVRYLVSGKIADGIGDAISLSRSLHVASNGNKLSIPLPAKKSRLKKLIQEEKFDVLHVQTPYSPMMGAKLIKLSPKTTAVIGTFHIVPNSWYLSVGDWFLGKWLYRSLKRFDKMLSVSTAAQRIAKRDFGKGSEVLPNVVDYAKFNSATPLAKYQDDKINILFLGRLVRRKGCLTILKAVKILAESKDNFPECRIIICGAGPLERKLKRYAKRHKLSGMVDFTGFISEEDKPKYLASANISIFPSTGGESFGIVLLEAMASGNSLVLAGNNVGYSSVLSSQPSLLFNRYSPKNLADALKLYLNNPNMRSEKAAWGENFTKDFDVKIVGSKLLGIYEDALIKRKQKDIM